MPVAMIPELWNFGLTPDQGLKIATIIANWSMVDNEIGHLIQRISGVKDAKDGADLIHVIDLKKKVDILSTRRKQGRLPAALNELGRVDGFDQDEAADECEE